MALQHLRSSTAHKRPIPTVMSAGQIAINTNQASPGLFFKDSNGDLVKVGPVHIGTTAPNSSPASVAATALVTGTVYQILTVGTSDFTLVGASANTVGTVFTATGTTTGTGTVSGQQGVEKGEQWLDTTGGTYVLKIYDGTDWRSESGTFVDVSGDTMTGALLLDNAASASAPDLSFDGDANTGIYSPGADQLAISTSGTAAVTVDSSQRVGVGTTSPGDYNVSADQLVVSNTSSACGITIASSTANTGNIFFADGTSGSAVAEGYVQYNHAGNYLAYGTANTERLRIDSSGNVGIGTSSPNNYSGYTTLTLNGSTGPALDLEVSSTRAGYLAATISGVEIGTSLATPLMFSTNATERMRIDSSGRLLVGTSSARTIATQSLAIQNEGTSFGTTGFSTCRNSNDVYGPYIHFGKSRGTSVGSNTIVSSGDDLGGLIFGGADGTDVDSQAAYIICQVDGTPGANDMPGRLVFFTTADGAAGPTERMRITQQGNHYHFANSGQTVVWANSANAANTSGILFRGRHSVTSIVTGGTDCFFVYANGNVQNTNNSYGSISDAKLKENIVDANSQWDDIKDLRIRNYNFIEGQTHTQIGVVAQEVETVSPGLVYETPDIDEDGNDLGATTKSVNYSVLYMKAVKALQEAMERIETLEAKVAALEAS